MKRTQKICLEKMRKCGTRFYLKPLAISIAALSVGCSQKQDAVLVKNVEECQWKTSLNLEECKAAYKQALAEAERTGPRYNNKRYCEEEFGNNQCVKGDHGFFMPLMTGFLVANALNSVSGYSSYYHPAYTYRNYRYRDQVILSDGSVLGKSNSSSYKVPDSTLKKKMPTAKRTISRGGFGSKASARSSWGGGSRSGGWGG